jgi:probable HAF family extracellular repeat protein
MAFVWLPQPASGLPAGMSELGTLPLGVTNGSWPGAIDNCGRIVGTSIGNTPGTPSTLRAFLWQDGVMLDLGAKPGVWSGALATSDKDVVVGWSDVTPGESMMRAFATRIRCGTVPDGGLIDLGSLGGSWSQATAVNDKGQVVGTTSFRLPSGSVIGVPFSRDARGDMIDLPLLSGATFGSALALNERGAVVGSCLNTRGAVTERAALWRRTHAGWSITELGSFVGTTRNVPTAIDEQERVVGYASLDGNDWHAYLWSEGEFYALDDLLETPSPIRIARTGGVNRRGDIAAAGYNELGEYRAFLLLRVR